MEVGVVIIATGELYHGYLGPLLSSINVHFLSGIKVNRYLWTDKIQDFDLAGQFLIEKEIWPYPTLHRYHNFDDQRDILIKNDYIFYLDVDMLLVDTVGAEILGDGLTATLHPCFTLSENYLPPYEQNKGSRAYIPRFRYYAGGFQGGRSEDFLRMSAIIRANIDADERDGIIATWHDESHFNKYLTETPPVVALSPSYCFPEDAAPGRSEPIRAHFVSHVWEADYPPKILALTKPEGIR